MSKWSGGRVGLPNNSTIASSSGVWSTSEQMLFKKQNLWPVNDITYSGLTLYLDAEKQESYPGSGNTWFDISGNNYNFTLNNAGAYKNTGPKYMDFNGSFGAAYRSDIPLSGTVTYMVWTRILNSSATWRTLTRAQAGSSNHHIIIEADGWNIGMYNNSGLNSPSGFVTSGYSQQSLPNYNTSNWICMYWRFNTSSPFYRLSFNDTPGTIRGSSTATGSQYGSTGFGSLGAFGANSDPSQFWGDIAMFAAYDRVLSDEELLQNYNSTKSRFGL
jgi:hypothetical protein